MAFQFPSFSPELPLNTFRARKLKEKEREKKREKEKKKKRKEEKKVGFLAIS